MTASSACAPAARTWEASESPETPRLSFCGSLGGKEVGETAKKGGHQKDVCQRAVKDVALSLSLTPSLPPCLPPSLPPSPAPSLSLSVSLSQKHTHTHREMERERPFRRRQTAASLVQDGEPQPRTPHHQECSTTARLAARRQVDRCRCRSCSADSSTHAHAYTYMQMHTRTRTRTRTRMHTRTHLQYVVQ